jgi:hypothetical protein
MSGRERGRSPGHVQRSNSAPRHRLVSAAVLLLVLLVTAGAGAAVLVMTGPAPFDSRPRTMPVPDDAGPAAPPVVRECGTETATEPASLPLWCLSPDQHLENLSWSKWGGAVTTATGDLRDTACFCAGATPRDFPVTISLARSATKPGDDPYTLLTISFPGKRPAWAYQARFTFQWTTSGFISKETN